MHQYDLDSNLVFSEEFSEDINMLCTQITICITNIDTQMNQIYEATRNQPSKTQHTEIDPPNEEELLFLQSFSPDLNEDEKKAETPESWQYDYYSDDDDLAHNFADEAIPYDETPASPEERKKILKEIRARKSMKT